MNFVAAIADFFKTSRWFLNLLGCVVCLLIPVAGLMAVLGWINTGLWARRDQGAGAAFPAFSFSNFSENVSRGAVPVAAWLVASVLLLPLAVIIFYIVPTAGSLMFSAGGFMEDVVVVLMYVLGVAVWLAFFILMSPVMLRAAMTQEFGSAFNASFARRFLLATLGELFLVALFMAGLAVATTVLGWLPPYVTPLVIAPVSLFAWQHLLKQLYHLYLRRGGLPVALGANLNLVQGGASPQGAQMI